MLEISLILLQKILNFSILDCMEHRTEFKASNSDDFL